MRRKTTVIGMLLFFFFLSGCSFDEPPPICGAAPFLHRNLSLQSYSNHLTISADYKHAAVQQVLNIHVDEPVSCVPFLHLVNIDSFTVKQRDGQQTYFLQRCGAEPLVIADHFPSVRYDETAQQYSIDVPSASDHLHGQYVHEVNVSRCTPVLELDSGQCAITIHYTIDALAIERDKLRQGLFHFYDEPVYLHNDTLVPQFYVTHASGNSGSTIVRASSSTLQKSAAIRDGYHPRTHTYIIQDHQEGWAVHLLLDVNIVWTSLILTLAGIMVVLMRANKKMREDVLSFNTLKHFLVLLGMYLLMAPLLVFLYYALLEGLLGAQTVIGYPSDFVTVLSLILCILPFAALLLSLYHVSINKKAMQAATLSATSNV